jgi:hypothetical protein
VKPILQALVLADHVYQDKLTGKTIVVGIFNNLNIFKTKPSEPIEGPQHIDPRKFFRPGSPYCYINLSSVHGTIPLELRYVDLKDNSVLMYLNFEVTNPDPLRNIEIITPVPPLPVPHPGSYVLELLTNDELIGSHRINATEEKTKEDES